MATRMDIQKEIPQIGCEKCDGFGNLFTPEGVKPCECKIRAMMVTQLASAQIPPMYSRKSFDTFRINNSHRKQAYEKCKSFVEQYPGNSQGLLFMGACGTGKTHLAVSILYDLVIQGNTGLFYNVISLLDDLRSSYAQDNFSTQFPILEKVCGVDILVLDDLGAEKTSGWVNDRLYAIINHRYERQKTILVTTNRDIPDLREQIGYRIYSRLMEMCHTVIFEGEDYRVQMMKSGKS